jgi:hypothetical protein
MELKYETDCKPTGPGLQVPEIKNKYLLRTLFPLCVAETASGL